MAKTIYLADFGSDNLEGLLKGFEYHLKNKDRGQSTRAYLGDVRRFAKWITERTRVFNPQGVSPLDLVEYRKHLQEHGGRQGKGAAPATVNRALTSLRLFFGWLVTQGVCKDNPVEDIKPVAVSKTPVPKWLLRTEQTALMRAVREGGSRRDEAILGLLLHAGLRVAELCVLGVDDIVLNDRSGHIKVTGKGNKYREVPLNITIRKILTRWFEENAGGVLFPNRYGNPIGTRGVFKLVEGYAYNARLSDVSPHTLRHTFCKNAVDLGIPIDQVAMMAGHSSLDVTKRYTVPSMEDLQSAVERMAWN
ncbi:tyrosine-type recombinase/integrase [Desulfotomaculum defluvii]